MGMYLEMLKAKYREGAEKGKEWKKRDKEKLEKMLKKKGEKK